MSSNPSTAKTNKQMLAQSLDEINILFGSKFDKAIVKKILGTTKEI
jgi:hypothetical protein